MAQLQKQNGGGDAPSSSKQKMRDDVSAKNAVERAKEAIKKADAVQEKKKGQWVECCGIRTWVPSD